MTNPYSPPTSEVRDPVKPPGSATKAIAFGLLADIGGTLTGGGLLGLIYGFQMASSGATQEQVHEAMVNVPAWSWYFIASTILGFGCSILGGYVCERIACRGDYSLGLLLGAISMTLGVVLGWSHYSLSAHLLMATVGLACVLFGVRMAIGRP